MIKKLSLLYVWFVRTLLILFPDIPILMRIRGSLYSLVMNECGHNFQVSATTLLRSINKLSVGNNVYLAPFVVLNAIDDIILEDEVMVGFHSVITSGNHIISQGSYRFSPSIGKPIVIKHGCWIAAHCTVLPGTYLPQGAILAANSCLTKKYDDGVLFGGVPAVRIK
ncbi:Maltose O-acetyltransferase [compost metagenome]